jgi:hypothetical protein
MGETHCRMKGVYMIGKHLLYVLALVATPVAASAAQVPSAVYNGLNYGRPRTHAGPAVRVASPGHYRHSDEHHHRDDRRHDDSHGDGS